jgi:hypothetical protein
MTPTSRRHGEHQDLWGRMTPVSAMAIRPMPRRPPWYEYPEILMLPSYGGSGSAKHANDRHLDAVLLWLPAMRWCQGRTASGPDRVRLPG